MPFPPGAAEKIRAKMDAGTLPRGFSGKMFAGYGGGDGATGARRRSCPTRSSMNSTVTMDALTASTSGARDSGRQNGAVAGG